MGTMVDGFVVVIIALVFAFVYKRHTDFLVSGIFVAQVLIAM